MKDIFASSAWTDFCDKNLSRIRTVVLSNIDKVLACGTKKLGYGVYECECGFKKKVCFTCKSRFCSSCGKVAADNWMNKVISWAPSNIKYRHIVFTIPEELRAFLLVYRKKGLDILFKSSSQALLYVFLKRYNCKPGIMSVMHTFGGDIKWNPHMHVIVTNGGLSLDLESWNSFSFIPYSLLNNSWKYNVVTELRKWGKKKFCEDKYEKFNRWLNKLYEKKWYINIGKELESLEFTVKYVGRYAKRPVLAETRLQDFKDDMVSFSFKDKKSKKESILTLTVEKFIGRLIRHIPNRYHRMIRYSGIFASRVKGEFLLKVNNLLCEGQQQLVYLTKPNLNWRERLIKFTGIDPLECSSCKKIMFLSSLVFKIKGGGFKVVNFSP